MLVQSGRPVGVMRTHEWAPRVLIANSNLVPDWANWTEFRRLEHLGLTMYGQMTAGSWIYIGTQGILQGTYETFAAVAAKKFGGSLAGTITLTAGLGGMGGAQPLAVTMNGGVAIVVEVDRLAHRPPDRARLPRRGGRRARRRAVDPAHARRATRRAALDRPARQRRVVVPELLAMGAPIDIVTDQTSAHDPLAYLPVGVDFADWHDAAPRPEGFATRARDSMARTSRRWSGSSAPAPRSSTTATTSARRPDGRVRGRVRLPGLRARLHPPALRRGQGPVPLGGALRRPGGHREDRPRGARPVPRERVARALDPPRAGARALPGPARPHLLARLRRARQGRPALQRHGRLRRARRADRDRPRPPRRRLGRLALPGDGGDEGRLRRDRRLAAAQRAREHRVGRDLGVDPPRRRRRHRPLDPRRAGLRRRRHRPRPREARAGAHERPRHGRDPARRRRLRGGGCGRRAPSPCPMRES